MSLKVPKSSQIQLFKDGYKVGTRLYKGYADLMLFFASAANVRARGRRPTQHSGGRRVIRSRTDEFWAQWCAIVLSFCLDYGCLNEYAWCRQEQARN